jgi:hypothetical protein
VAVVIVTQVPEPYFRFLPILGLKYSPLAPAVTPPTYAKEGTMKIERSQLVGITSILDRNGKRVGNYIVDRSKDSLNREKKKDPSKPEEEEAVVVHSTENESQPERLVDVDLKASPVTGSLDITV